MDVCYDTKRTYNHPAAGGTTIPLALASCNSAGIDSTRNQLLYSGWGANGDGNRFLRSNSQLGSRPRGTRAQSDLPLGSNQTITLHRNKSGSGFGSRKNQTGERRGLNRGANGTHNQKTEPYPDTI